MKNLKYIISLCLTLALFTSCEDINNEFGLITAPSNLQITAEIVGLDVDNPFGDGSGFVNFSATADNAISYQYTFGDGTSVASGSGAPLKRFTKVGVNTFTVIVKANGTGGIQTTATLDVSVYSSFSDPEAEIFLTGSNVGDAKTWVWASDIPLHIGLGPAFDDYGGGEFAWPNWWNAIEANDPEKSCMYTNEFVFTRTENGLTFEQTMGPAFVPGAYASVIGVDGDTCHDETVAPTMFGVKNISFFPSGSKAALEGSINENPYRKTSFQLSDGGFMGWYVGDVVYDIISITENTLHVRCLQEGSPYSDGGYAWYAKYKVAN